MGGAAFSAVKILIPSLKGIGQGTPPRFRPVHVSPELPPRSPQKEESGEGARVDHPLLRDW